MAESVQVIKVYAVGCLAAAVVQAVPGNRVLAGIALAVQIADHLTGDVVDPQAVVAGSGQGKGKLGQFVYGVGP